MEIRALRYYRAVCEYGTMSRAAEALHMTQPALSRQIAALERELGCEARRVATGALARLIVPYCNRCLELDEHLSMKGLYRIWERNQRPRRA